jgi:hypothetical protein
VCIYVRMFASMFSVCVVLACLCVANESRGKSGKQFQSMLHLISWRICLSERCSVFVHEKSHNTYANNEGISNGMYACVFV